MPRETFAGSPAESAWVRSLCLPPSHRIKMGIPMGGGIFLPAAVDYAKDHGLMSLLLHGFSKIDPSFSPIRFLHQETSCPWIDVESGNQLRRGYLGTLRSNLSKLSALKEINEAFRGIGKPCILWKGAALIQGVYSNPALRPMDDIDILVFKENLSIVKSGLADIGFRQMPFYPMVWQKKGILIDLHLDVMHSDRIASRKHFFPLSIDEMQGGLQRLPDMENLAIPDPGDMLLLCAVHALKHDFSRDIWIADGLHIFHRYPELIEDQNLLFQRAEQFNALLPMEILLHRMEAWHREIGIDMTAYRKAVHTGPIAGVLVRGLCREKQLPGSGELLTALMIPSMGKRLRFFLETAFPSETVMRQLFVNQNSSPRWRRFPRRIASLLHTLWKLLQSVL